MKSVYVLRGAAGIAVLACVACGASGPQLVDDQDAATEAGDDGVTEGGDDRVRDVRDDGPADEGDTGPVPRDRPAPAFSRAWNVTGSLWAPGERLTLRPLLRWNPPDDDGGGPLQYEIHVDDSCGPAEGPGCDFPSPEAAASGIVGTSWRPAEDLAVAETPPVGRLYGWRVRGCRGSTCTPWSRIAYVGVGRAPKDFDGDGYSDVAAGGDGPTEATAVDRQIFVYRGGSTGVEPSPYVALRNPLHPSYYDDFGWRLAVAGDVNADGFADLLVPAYGPDRGYLDPPSLGWVYLYYGGPGGLRPDPDVTFPDPGDEPGSYFGESAEPAGDLDGDGYDDVVIGASRENREDLENGLVFFYRGGPSGVDPEPTAILDSPPGSQGGFGTVVAGTGDFDGDGYGDLAAVAMGRLGADVGEGAVYVFHGGPGGIETVARTVVGNPVGIPGWLFGHSAVEVVGNADGDGYGDLAVDGCLNDVGGPVLSGVYVYRGGRTGLGVDPYASLLDPSDSTGLMTSCRLAADDLDGDGLTDLMVSVPGSWAGLVGPGLVYVYSAHTGEFPTSPGVILSYPFATEYTGGFGTDVAAAGDVNGDGNPDVVVGCRGCGTSAIADGAVIIFPGAGEGLDSSSAVALENPVPWADALFGYSVE